MCWRLVLAPAFVFELCSYVCRALASVLVLDSAFAFGCCVICTSVVCGCFAYLTPAVAFVLASVLASTSVVGFEFSCCVCVWLLFRC